MLLFRKKCPLNRLLIERPPSPTAHLNPLVGLRSWRSRLVWTASLDLTTRDAATTEGKREKCAKTSDVIFHPPHSVPNPRATCRSFPGAPFAPLATRRCSKLFHPLCGINCHLRAAARIGWPSALPYWIVWPPSYRPLTHAICAKRSPDSSHSKWQRRLDGCIFANMSAHSAGSSCHSLIRSSYGAITSFAAWSKGMLLELCSKSFSKTV